MKMTQGMFGGEFGSAEQFEEAIKLFGLRTGRMCGRGEIGHNAGWYNKEGEKLGFGDLDKSDIPKIQKALEPGQWFITLGEQDSFWAFVTSFGPIGAMCGRTENEKNPGQKYVAEHYIYAFTKDKVYCSHQRSDHGEFLSREDLFRMISP
jgi:hypothetical protein